MAAISITYFGFVFCISTGQLSAPGGIIDRRNVPDILCKRKPGRTGIDDCFQHFVWHHFLFRFILWGNGDLSWNDDANGGCFAYFVGEKSI